MTSSNGNITNNQKRGRRRMGRRKCSPPVSLPFRRLPFSSVHFPLAGRAAYRTSLVLKRKEAKGVSPALRKSRCRNGYKRMGSRRSHTSQRRWCCPWYSIWKPLLPILRTFCPLIFALNRKITSRFLSFAYFFSSLQPFPPPSN